ncbi:MAG: DUF4349 domain-containing protein [Ilumatobacteraceae bacterium]
MAGGAATTAAAASDGGASEAGTGASEVGEVGEGIIAPAAQVPGQQIAIEARASVQVGDVRAAVDRLTTTVTTRGGRVAAADIDYDPRPIDPTTGEPDDVDDSQATLVLSVPPGELASMESTLREVGSVTSFDQLAEDVTEQLADLDNRIANLRASVERVRALLAEAVDIDGIVRLEAELTSRETELERLLATQRQLDDRVAMSTLTIEITTTPTAAAVTEPEDDPGLVGALGAGWNAFMTGLYTIALVLAAIAPFVGAAMLLAALALILRRAVLRRRPPAQPPVVP